MKFMNEPKNIQVESDISVIDSFKIGQRIHQVGETLTKEFIETM